MGTEVRAWTDEGLVKFGFCYCIERPKTFDDLPEGLEEPTGVVSTEVRDRDASHKKRPFKKEFRFDTEVSKAMVPSLPQR